jgi:hypothetical protein
MMDRGFTELEIAFITTPHEMVICDGLRDRRPHITPTATIPISPINCWLITLI